MKKEKNNFDAISLCGRFAYSVMCAERYAVAKYPEKDWKRLFSWLWKGTSGYFDEWYYHFMEILPKYLYEFDNYKDAAFDYLSEDDYNYYVEFLKNIDKNMERLLEIPSEISMVYSYTSIPGKGRESINLVNEAISILEENSIKLPAHTDVEFSSFSENNGWGNPFEGEFLSIILNHR